jgi:hypothetical protein
VTDGNLPFPQTGSTTYSSSTPPGCGGTQTPAPGFLVPTYASGFLSRGGVFGNINFGCGVDGTYGLAWDSAGNLYAGDQVDGNLYKIPPGGGVANSSTMVAHIAQTLSGLVFDKNGNLFGSVMTTPSGFNTGYVVRINPGTGAVLQTVASGLTCPEALSVDPISGDLFTDDACSGSGSDNPSLWRISNPASANPTTTVYATLPHTPNANIGFAPDGTMYIWDSGQGVKVTGTNGPNPPVQTVIPPLGSDFIGTLAFGTQPGGGAQFVISNFPADTTVTPNAPGRTAILDLTRPTLTVGTELAEPGAQGMQVGPDGCVYLAQGVAIWKITNPAGGCQYSAANPAPGLSLTPAKPATNPSQGQSVSLSARFLFATAPDGTPVQLVVSGANPQVIIQSKTMNGSASFAYAGAKQGVDTLTAFALLNGSELASNQAVVTWGPGTDLTFLTVNPSPISAMQGQSVTLIANLTDNSVKPVAPLSGQQVKLSVGGTSCSASTNSNGNASCAVTPGTAGVTTLSATFAGTSQYNPSSDSKGFHVIAPVTTPTPTPIATPSPVPGRLRISPKMLNFGSVNVGSSKPRTVTITNLGRITKKKHPVAITIEMENSSQPAVFAVSQCPPNDPLQPGNKGQKPGSCVVTVTFKPAAATKYSGTLTVTDNVEPSAKPPQVGFMQTVQLKGAGKVPK